MSRMQHRRFRSIHRSLPLAAALALAPALLAQGADPQQAIQDIAERVGRQLQEIDRMLLESSDRQQQRSRPKQLLEQSTQRSTEVVEGITELIEKLIAAKNQAGGGC